MCNAVMIRHIQTNGQCEQANSIIIPAIITSTKDETNWYQNIPEMEFKLNNMFDT